MYGVAPDNAPFPRCSSEHKVNAEGTVERFGDYLITIEQHMPSMGMHSCGGSGGSGLLGSMKI